MTQQTIKTIETNTIDGDQFGNEWKVAFFVTQSENNELTLWRGDTNGNGDFICKTDGSIGANRRFASVLNVLENAITE